MKTKILFVSLLCALISVKSFSQAEGERYYYSLNKKIFLREIDDKMVVSFQRNNAADAKARLQTERAIQKNDSVCIVDVASNRKESLKRDLSQIAGVKSVQPMYAADGVTDKFIKK